MLFLMCVEYLLGLRDGLLEVLDLAMDILDVLPGGE
jgi:hypothetical protein